MSVWDLQKWYAEMKDACRDEGCRKNKKKKLRASEE
jgi:hypothetical protein